jgi:CheY-like chemotaxis protein
MNSNWAFTGNDLNVRTNDAEISFPLDRRSAVKNDKENVSDVGSFYSLRVPSISGRTINTVSMSGSGSASTYVPKSAGLRILIVDDAPSILKMSSAMLRRKGYDVEIAVNGLDALEKINMAVVPFDVVLMDLQMPIMDGLEAMRRIRYKEACGELPSGESDKVYDSGSGMEGFIKDGELEQANRLSCVKSVEPGARVITVEVDAVSKIPILPITNVTGFVTNNLSSYHTDHVGGKLFVSSKSFRSRSCLSERANTGSLTSRSERCRNLFIVGVSACSDSETIEDAFSAGADVFIAKPFTIDSFLQATKLLRDDIAKSLAAGVIVNAGSETGNNENMNAGKYLVGSQSSGQNVSHVTFFDEDDSRASNSNAVEIV